MKNLITLLIIALLPLFTIAQESQEVYYLKITHAEVKKDSTVGFKEIEKGGIVKHNFSTNVITIENKIRFIVTRDVTDDVDTNENQRLFTVDLMAKAKEYIMSISWGENEIRYLYEFYDVGNGYHMKIYTRLIE